MKLQLPPARDRLQGKSGIINISWHGVTCGVEIIEPMEYAYRVHRDGRGDDKVTKGALFSSHAVDYNIV